MTAPDTTMGSSHRRRTADIIHIVMTCVLVKELRYLPSYIYLFINFFVILYSNQICDAGK